jgi:hypothetical protein
MSTKVTFEPAANLVTVVANGSWGLAEAIKTFDAFLAAPEFSPGMDVLVDLREARITPSPGDTQKLARYIRLRQGERGTGYKLAIVAIDGIERVVAETYQTLVKTHPVNAQVFSDPTDAHTWLRQGA